MPGILPERSEELIEEGYQSLRKFFYAVDDDTVSYLSGVGRRTKTLDVPHTVGTGELLAIREHIVEFEDAKRNREWKEADYHIEEIKDLMKDVYPMAKRGVTRLIAELRGIEDRDADDIAEGLRALKDGVKDVEDALHLMDKKSRRRYSNRHAMHLREKWRGQFDQAADELDLSGLPAAVQNTVVEGFAALNDENDAQKALRKFKKARQDVSGRAGNALDEMIAALEESDVVSRELCGRCKRATIGGMSKEEILERHDEGYYENNSSFDAQDMVDDWELIESFSAWQYDETKQGSYAVWRDRDGDLVVTTAIPGHGIQAVYLDPGVHRRKVSGSRRKRKKLCSRCKREASRRKTADGLDVLNEIVKQSGDGRAVGPNTRRIDPEGSINTGVKYDLYANDSNITNAMGQLPAKRHEFAPTLHIEPYEKGVWEIWVRNDRDGVIVGPKKVEAPTEQLERNKRAFEKRMYRALNDVFQEAGRWGLELIEEAGSYPMGL